MSQVLALIFSHSIKLVARKEDPILVARWEGWQNFEKQSFLFSFFLRA